MRNLFLFFTSVVLICSACEKEEPILTFNNIKSERAKHIGEGVWLDVPSFYKKAKTYDGFQAPGYESSISLQVDNATFEEVENSFSEEVLGAKRTKLLTFQKVPFGKQDSAIFTIVHDKRKGTIKYLLSVRKDGYMYGVKAFCHKALRDKYDLLIKTSLQSVAFAEVIVKKEPFVFAQLPSLMEVIYTRDGEYPTKSADEATIIRKSLKTKEVSFSSSENSDLLEEEMGKYTSNKTSNVRFENVGEGYYITVFKLGEDLNVFGAFITDGDKMNEMYIGTCKTVDGINEISKYIRNSNIKTVVGLR